MMKILRLILVLALVLALAACGTAAQTRVVSDLTVRLELEPSPPTSGQPARLRLAAERAGQPLEDARFMVMQRMPAMGHSDAAPQHLMLEGGTGETSFAMPGRWELQVAVSVADRQPEVVTFELDVE